MKTNENNNKLNKRRQQLDISLGTQKLSTVAESACGVTSSDEERAAYADRRNGLGARLVPALQNKFNNKRNKEQAQQQNIHLQVMNNPTLNVQNPPQSPNQPHRYTNETDFNGFIKPLEKGN